MILIVLQIAVIGCLGVYLFRWRTAVRRRNAQSWDSLIARLRPDWSARELSDQFLWKEGVTVTQDEIWDRIEGPHGLWAMYQNASVLLEMADYAADSAQSSAEPIDPMVIEALRSDAMQIRLCVLMALAQYALSKATEGVKINAYRAASHYSNMAARMTALLQNHAAIILPDFVAAM